MRKLWVFGLVAIVALAGLTLRIAARDDDEAIALAARLTGFQETPLTLSTPATGTFRAVFEDGPSIEFRLSYSGFTSDVKVAHIHIGAPATTGGVTVFLCGGDGRPACPARAGTVTGTITAANIRALPAQGLAAGDFRALVRAIRNGATYVNAHSVNFPGGEIRGRIRVVEREEDRERDNDREDHN